MNIEPKKSVSADETQLPRNGRFGILTFVRIVIAAVVVVALVYMVSGAVEQLQETEFSLSEVRPGWWCLAVVSYIFAMALSGTFWHRVLLALGQSPKFTDSMLAFFTSQLAKYVPGKAMVVVVRTDMIRGPNVETGPAAASVFVETLTWIFVGSAISSLLIAIEFREQKALGATAVVLTLIAGILTWPSVFRTIAARIAALKSGSRHDANGNSDNRFAGLNLSTMLYGWCVMSLGWCLNGLSLWLVLRGLPESNIAVSDFPLVLVCVALATVAGFVSLLPGGIGVRELVIIPLLGARFGPVTAVVAAIVIRFVWLASELFVSAIMYLLTRFFRPAA